MGINEGRLRDVKETIVQKLFSNHCFGTRQLQVNKLKKGIPLELRGLVPIAIKELKKEGILVPKKEKHGLKYYLNKNKMSEIYSYLPYVP